MAEMTLKYLKELLQSPAGYATMSSAPMRPAC